MPELPEVETIKCDLEKAILHKTFRSVEILDSFVLRSPTVEFIKALSKQSITAISRRGKELIIQTANGYHLVVQLRYRWLRENFEPVDQIAYSHLVYDIRINDLEKRSLVVKK